MPNFNLYDFIGLKHFKKSIIGQIFGSDTYYFIREITDTQLICDEYKDEDILKNHIKIPLEKSGDYELKTVKSTFKIRTRKSGSAQFIDDPKIYNTIQEIVDSIPDGTFWSVWKAEIICDVDCRRLNIDPSAPWPPKAA